MQCNVNIALDIFVVLFQAADMDGEIDLSTCYDVTEFPVQRNYGFQILVSVLWLYFAHLYHRSNLKWCIPFTSLTNCCSAVTLRSKNSIDTWYCCRHWVWSFLFRNIYLFHREGCHLTYHPPVRE